MDGVMSELPDSVLRQIAALQNMTVERGATEAEAQTAMSKLQAILFKYNLDLAEINVGREQGPSFKEDYQFTTERKNRTPGSGFKQRSAQLQDYEREWRVQLAIEVARYNFCRVLTDQKFIHVLFIGSHVNVEVVRSMWEYACEQVDALSYVALKERRKNKLQQAIEGWESGKTWRRAWMFGCVTRLAHRLYEDWAKLRDQSGASKALVVSNDAALIEYVNNRASGNTIEWSKRKPSFGYEHGYKAGDKVNLTKNPARLS